MRPKSLAILIGALALGLLPAAAQKVSVKDLNPRYRAWLEEEVVYIISPREKSVFLQLANDREREMFITAFWRARDEDTTTTRTSSRTSTIAASSTPTRPSAAA